MTWPDGFDRPLLITGRARDVFTPATVGDDDLQPEILDEATLAVRICADEGILSVDAAPAPTTLDALLGSGPGRGFRRAIAAAFPDGDHRSSLIYFLVEDLTTAPLLSSFALSQRAETRQRFIEVSSKPISSMEGICSGYRPGGVGLELRRRGIQGSQNPAVIAPSTNDDPTAAWYPLESPGQVAMCRRRRIDVFRGADSVEGDRVEGDSVDGDSVEVDAMFRDHTWDDAGNEVAVHEYELSAVISGGGSDPTLASVTATPRVIPYPDCPAAATKVDCMVGASVSSLRRHVLDELRGVDSCTHLNDMLRALAELPSIMDKLPS